uniref:THAP-type domain-containing protein n=1 Tax=Glossina brevipalpis TaxID=37001 RepID=A0A1A9X2N3_9MUSC
MNKGRKYIVRSCNASNDVTKKQLKNFFYIHPLKLQQWLQILQQQETGATTYYICDDHFQSDDVVWNNSRKRLKPDAVPSRNLHIPANPPNTGDRIVNINPSYIRDGIVNNIPPNIGDGISTQRQSEASGHYCICTPPKNYDYMREHLKFKIPETKDLERWQ